MIIGIEAERANNPVKTGVEHYAKQLILHLADIDGQNQYILYLRSQPEDWLLKLPGNFKVKVMPFPLFWTQLRISWEILFHPVDVLFIPASALPIIHPKKSVVTIHDLGWKFYPDSFTWFTRSFLEWSTRFAVKRASSIIAVSESTKRDLVKFYGVNGKKIIVVHHGYENVGQARLSAEALAKADGLLPMMAGHGPALQGPYILFLSTLQPRKNLEGLIDAFSQLKKENPELPHKLVVVGKPGWKFESILKKIHDNKNIVTYLNYVSNDDRLAIMAKADLLVLPSFYEGFGMQILESFSAGVPVATSNISGMPEVAGEAAVYFDPHNIAEIKNAIKSVLLDKSLSERLKEKGRQRLKDFSWQKCAEQTLGVLNS
jgi:glycosyltransferase involved in cell wall biosynthesis